MKIKGEKRFVKMLTGLTILFGLICWESIVAQTHDDKPIELSGFSISQTFEIEDRQPVNLADESLIKLIYRISKTTRPVLESYARYTEELTWDDIQNDTANIRLRVFQISADVNRFERHRLPGAQQDDPIRGVYLAHCKTAEGQPFQVVALDVPSKWDAGQPLDEPIRFTGFLYGLVATEKNTEASRDEESGEALDSVPLFIARRLEWYPQAVSEPMQVDMSHVLLAKQGVDIGQFDKVRQQNKRPLGTVDSEMFFQLLSVVDSVAWEPTSIQPLGFANLMQQPDSFGRAVQFAARVKKCSVVQVDDEGVAQQLGFDRYYQLIVFPDLDGGQIVVHEPNGEKLVYRRFPVTVCARTLPGQLAPEDVENQKVLLQGFYFRFWTYQSDFTDQAGSVGQISPIIITALPAVLESDRELLNFVLGLVLVGLLLLLAVMLYFFRSGGKDSTEGHHRLAFPDKIDLDGLND